MNDLICSHCGHTWDGGGVSNLTVTSLRGNPQLCEPCWREWKRIERDYFVFHKQPAVRRLPLTCPQ